MSAHGYKRSVPNFASKFERNSPMRTSHSSPAALNHDQWVRTYKEGVREYGPPKNGQPSLFLFGRDEFERSELAEVDQEKTPEVTATPVNTPAYPISYNKEDVVSAPRSSDLSKLYRHLPKNPNVLSSEGIVSPPQKYSTLPTQSRWTNGQKHDSDPEHDRKFSSNVVDWPSNRRRQSVSWPSMVPRMRYIYAYPEEVPSLIQQRSEKGYLPETSKHTPSNYMPRKLFESTTPEHRAHGNLIDELKARFQASSNEEETDTGAALPPTDKDRRHSPQHAIPADPPPPIRPIHKSSALKQTRDPFDEIHRMLQSNESHVLPVIDRYLRSNFGSDPQKTLDLTQFHESEVPLRHYWDRVFRVSDGQKCATIKIENLLTIENGGDQTPRASMPSLLDPRTRSKPSLSYKTQQTSSSPYSSTDEAASWQKPSDHHSYVTVMSTTESKQPTKASTLKTESDLLSLVHRKISRGIPLEWPDLFLLKNSHCRWVVRQEREFRRLTAEQPKHEKAWRRLSSELTSAYLQYQEVLERARTIDDLYTDLAHSIMKAESFWYGARICTDHQLRTTWYRSSIYLYKQLLEKARSCLSPSDRSLLTILDKLSTIMLESCQADPVTVQACRAIVGSTEQALDMEVNLKVEKKLFKIKSNLVRIEANLLR